MSNICPKISIIVPVYNAEKYLEECLDSLINQTLEDIEIICVNYGSTDGSKLILENYEEKDSRIVVIEQKKCYCGAAKNRGLEIAKGKYIQFLNAEDFYEFDCCENLYKVMQNNNINVACFEANVINDTLLPLKDNDYNCFALKNEGLVEFMSAHMLELDANCWNKIFKRSFLIENNVKFSEDLHYEDYGFFWSWGVKVSFVYYLKKKLIYYRRNDGYSFQGLLLKNRDNINDIVDIFQLIYECIKKERINKECLKIFLKCLFKLTSLLFSHNEDLKNEIYLLKTMQLIEKFKFNELFFTRDEWLEYYEDILSAWAIIPKIYEKQFLDLHRTFLNVIEPYGDDDLVLIRITLDFIKNNTYLNAKYNLNIEVNKKFKTNKINKFQIQEALKPVFAFNKISIVFNCDNKFVKYLSVAIQSIIDNSSKENNYDIVVLNENITDNNQEILKCMVKDFENFSIRFYNMNNLVNEYGVKSWFTTNHLNHSAYYRLFIPKIFGDYDRIIYLDADLILRTDIARLYSQDMGNCVVAAVEDFSISQSTLKDGIYWKDLYSYLVDTLAIKNIKKYFNSGVLLLDIKNLNDNYFEKFVKIAEINNKFFHDQNVLNSALQDCVHLLDIHWNIQIGTNANIRLKNFNPDNANIIHYCSNFKPWNRTVQSLTDKFWWEYAKKTPFYEEIIFERVETMQKKERESFKKWQDSNDVNLVNVLKRIDAKNKMKFDYLRVKILSQITFGKIRKHYQYKKNLLRNKNSL